MRRVAYAAIAASLAVVEVGCGQSHHARTGRTLPSIAQARPLPRQPPATATTRRADHGSQPTTTSSSNQTSSTAMRTTAPKPALPPTAGRSGVQSCGHLKAGGTTYTIYASGVPCSQVAAVLHDEIAGKGRLHRGSNVATTFTVVDGWDCPPPRMGRIGCQRGDRSMQAIS